MGHRAGRFVTGLIAVLAAGATAAWLARLWWPVELWPEEQRWPHGSWVRWVDKPYVEQRPNGERLEVRAGDDGSSFWTPRRSTSACRFLPPGRSARRDRRSC
jgi:hypothetical protein